MKFLLGILFLIPTLVFSGNENHTVGGRATGMGNTGLCISDVWAVRYNQAALADLKYMSAGISYESRFFTNENDWKYTGVFVYDPLDIQKIKVEFKGQPESSYLVTQFDKKVQLNTVDGTSIKDFVKPLVENYILNYEKIYFNRIAELSENKVDSIMSLEPEYRIEVTVNNRPTKVDFYLKPSDNPSVDLVTGEENIWDENYIYGVMNGKKEVLVFQYFALGNVFSRKEYFIQ